MVPTERNRMSLTSVSVRSKAYLIIGSFRLGLPGGDNVVLLTTVRVLSFGSKKLRLDWDLLLANVLGVAVEDNGIRFSHKLGKDHDRFVLIPDKNALTWFFGQIASVVRAFNTRRRMDN